MTFEVVILPFIDKRENRLFGEKYDFQQDCPNGSLLFDKTNNLTTDFSNQKGFLPKFICSIFFPWSKIILCHEDGFFLLCLVNNYNSMPTNVAQLNINLKFVALENTLQLSS